MIIIHLLSTVYCVIKQKKKKEKKRELTGNVPVAIFQSVEVQHELPDGDFEYFKETHVLKERVRHL